jgi:hypothetical protein
MIRRETDARHLNAVANHPAVLPFVSLPGQDAIDLAPVVADRRNIALACEGGGFVCVWQEPGIYEVHSLFLPEARGVGARAAAREAIHGMFLQGDAMELLTKVPVGNVRAEALARRCGFRLDFEREGAWVWRGQSAAVRYYALRYPDYVAAYADDLEAHGRWFHDKLDVEEARRGIVNEHPEDRAHHIHAGAVVRMILSGQVAKGVVLYNRWARFAGYDPISVVSTDPLVVDVGSGILLTPSSDGFEVVPCQ